MKNTALQGNRATIKVLAMLFIIPLFLAVISAQIYTVTDNTGWTGESDVGNNMQGTGIITNNYNVFIQNVTIGIPAGAVNKPSHAYILIGGTGFPCDFGGIIANVTITYNATDGFADFGEVKLNASTHYGLMYNNLAGGMDAGYKLVTHPIGNSPDLQTEWRTLCGLNQTVTTGLITTIGETNVTTIIPPPPAMEINLNAPADNFTINSNRGRLNGTVENNWLNATIRNVTWFANFTGTMRGSHTITTVANNTLSNWLFPAQVDGYYTWLMESCNNQSKCFNSTERHFTLDDIPQVAILVSPVDFANFTSQYVTLTAYTSHDDSANLTFYINDTGTFRNISTINNPIGFVNYSHVVNLSFNATYFWSAYTCDSSGFCNFSTANRSFSDFFNPSINVYQRGIFYVDFTQGINQILVIIAIAFAIFLFIVNQRIISSVLVEAIGFIFLFNELNIILSLVFVLGGIIILFLQENDGLKR